jgi:hypothetical protein
MTKACVGRIPEALRAEIIDFCYNDSLLDWNSGYNSKGNDSLINRGRKMIYCHLTKFSDQIILLEQEYLNSIGPPEVILPATKDDILPHFIGWIYNENKKTMGIQKHIDSRKNGWHHLRINCLLQKPKAGGEPVVNNCVIDVKENQSWSVWASEHLHSALPVTHDTMRITVSFGFYVNPAHVNTVRQRLIDLVDVAVNN